MQLNVPSLPEWVMTREMNKGSLLPENLVLIKSLITNLTLKDLSLIHISEPTRRS